MNKNIIKFFKIRFYNWPFKKLIKKINKGGYLVAPAASSLCIIQSQPNHHKALKESSVAIFDSGFFCILLFLLKGIYVKKSSGFFFLYNFFKFPEVKNKKILCINPSIEEDFLNRKLLKKKKFMKVETYIAPMYNSKNIKDFKLLKLINLYKPKYILINIGSISQEQLAFFICQNSKYSVSCLCLGAAIGFFTGKQARITLFFDSLYFGWILRVIHNPKVFILRFIKSFYLLRLFFLKGAFE